MTVIEEILKIVVVVAGGKNKKLLIFNTFQNITSKRYNQSGLRNSKVPTYFT